MGGAELGRESVGRSVYLDHSTCFPSAFDSDRICMKKAEDFFNR